jgi:hypothetical protein
MPSTAECQCCKEAKREVSIGERDDSEHLIRDIRHERHEGDQQYEWD